MCSRFLCHVCGLNSLSLGPSLWFLIRGLVQVIMLTLVVNFQFFNIHFLVTTLGLLCFQVYILTNCGF